MPIPRWPKACTRLRCWRRRHRRPHALVVAPAGHRLGDRGHLGIEGNAGIPRLLPSLLCIGGYALAFYLLSVVVKYVPVGIAYALWSGIGVVIVSLVGWFFFHQKLDLPAMIGLGLIVAGVAVMHLFSKSMEL